MHLFTRETEVLIWILLSLWVSKASHSMETVEHFTILFSEDRCLNRCNILFAKFRVEDCFCSPPGVPQQQGKSSFHGMYSPSCLWCYFQFMVFLLLVIRGVPSLILTIQICLVVSVSCRSCWDQSCIFLVEMYSFLCLYKRWTQTAVLTLHWKQKSIS